MQEVRGLSWVTVLSKMRGIQELLTARTLGMERKPYARQGIKVCFVLLRRFQPQHAPLLLPYKYSEVLLYIKKPALSYP